jgi:uncharacterized SAM-binding protein YcdF (DUF218 family)
VSTTSRTFVKGPRSGSSARTPSRSRPGEAQAIARLAEEQGWSSQIAVTSSYHAHRATFLLGRCCEGPVQVVTPSGDLDVEDSVGKIGHEWAGFLAAIILQPAS